MQWCCTRSIAGLLCLLSVLVSGCVDPGLAPGFYVRSDMLTTDCAGNANPTDVNARDNRNPWAFLQADEENVSSVRVPDCKGSGPLVDRAVGLAVNFGDVILLGTTIVGPMNRATDVPLPATIAEPVRIPVRFVEPSGRLYPIEDQLLTAIFSMARGNEAAIPGNDLAQALDRRGPVLWDTLIHNIRFRRTPSDDATSRRNGLYATVDRGNWCSESFKLIRDLGDRDAASDATSIMGFLGPNGVCKDSELDEVSGILNPARSALHTVGVRSASVGPYPPRTTGFSLYTLAGIEVQGARLRTEREPSNVWTLLDWEDSRICRDSSGRKLKIKSINLHSRTFLEIVDAGPASHAVDVIFAQTNQQRRLIPPDGVSGTILRSDLDYLYVSDLHSIEWDGWPAVPQMCVLNPK
jgi:hypothetical protein